MIYPCSTERNEEERVVPKYSRPSIALRTSALNNARRLEFKGENQMNLCYNPPDHQQIFQRIQAVGMA